MDNEKIANFEDLQKFDVPSLMRHEYIDCIEKDPFNTNWGSLHVPTSTSAPASASASTPASTSASASAPVVPKSKKWRKRKY